MASESRTIAVCGLPESGKTTFLAALWHLVNRREIATKLSFASLPAGDMSHMNEIAFRWRRGQRQDRTKVGIHKAVNLVLRDDRSGTLSLSFPDISGESFRRIWEERECDAEVATALRSGAGILLFIHADRIERPQWTVDVAALAAKLGLKVNPGEPVRWHPRLAPTQVQVVELLQQFRHPALYVCPRRVAIMLSAWDKVEAEQLSPAAFLAERMPLLHQFLTNGAEQHRVYGISAQGGDYEPEPEAQTLWSREELQQLLSLDRASERIKVVTEGATSHDLTEPLSWLME